MELGRLALLLMLPPLVLASAFCSASETALFSLTQADRTRMRRSSPAAAGAVAALLAHPRGLLISLLLLNNLVNVVYFVLSSVLAAGFEGGGGLWAVLMGAASVLGLILLGEILPKLLASRMRYDTARLVAHPILALDRVIAPVRGAIDRLLVNPLARLVRPTGSGLGRVSTDEISQLLTLSAAEGAIGRDDQRLLQDVVDLSTLRVRQVMTHRVDMDWLEAAAPDADVMDLVRRSAANMILVCRSSPDREVLGWLDVKRHLAQRQATGRPPPLTDSLLPVLYVPERARLDQLLEVLRAARRYSGVCVDEYGAVVGIVSLADVMRRLVAEPASEGGSTGGVEPAGPGRWLVPGRMSIMDLAEMLDPARARRELDRTVSTIAGLFLIRLGRVPRVGDTVRLGTVELRVESMDGRAVERVLVTAGAAGREGGAA